MVRVTVKNAQATVARIMGLWDSKCQMMLADVIAGDCNFHVRMQNNALSNSMRIEENGKRITWNTPYAKRVYYTGTPRTNRNPAATLQWCEKAKGEYLADWQAAAQKLADSL